MKTKMSWGVIILITFIIFAGGIGLMVGISMTRNSDLVAENYYENELKYQDKIDVVNRTNSLPEKIKIEINPASIKIIYPSIFEKEKITGKINFYRAMNKKKDFEVEIGKNENNFQEISTSNMDKGSWKIQVSWNAKGTNYYNESNIFIN